MVVAAPPSMNAYQVYQLLLNNGADRQTAAYLAGISVWEAGGGNPNAINPTALNPVAPDYSVGLFQYNFRYPGGFNPSNPLASTRNGWSAGQLLGDLNAQAQSAIAMMGNNLAGISNWSTWAAHKASIQAIAMQLLGGPQPTVTDTLPPQIPLPIPGDPNQPIAPITTTNPTIPAPSSFGPFSLKLFSTPRGPVNLNLPWPFSSILLFLMAIFAIIIGVILWQRNNIVKVTETAGPALAAA